MCKSGGINNPPPLWAEIYDFEFRLSNFKHLIIFLVNKKGSHYIDCLGSPTGKILLGKCFQKIFDITWSTHDFGESTHSQ